MFSIQNLQFLAVFYILNSQISQQRLGIFVNNSSHDTVTSIRNILVQYGTFVHSEKYLEACSTMRALGVLSKTFTMNASARQIALNSICVSLHI